MTESLRKNEFTGGMKGALPLLIGTAPFGLIYGTLAVGAGLSSAAALGMSLLVFAGSAQFIAVGLYAASAPLLIIILTTLVVNLRHMLYSASLLPYMKHLSHPWRLLLAFLLTDEVYAVSIARLKEGEDSPHRHWYQLGASAAMYLNWQIWCTLGIFLGSRIPDADAWGLDFALPVTFIGMTIPFVKNVPALVCVAGAGVTALFTGALPFKLGLILAALVGVCCGLAAEMVLKQKQKLTDSAREAL